MPKKLQRPRALRWKRQAFFVGVPARDLTAEEAEKYGYEWLVNSGLYEPVEEKPKPQEAAQEEEWAITESPNLEKSS